MKDKAFAIAEHDLKPLINNDSGCFATDMITVDNYPVRYMYREEAEFEHDSGWRFMSGYESDEYLDNPDNHGIYQINTIANYDPSIIPFLESPPGSAFTKPSETELFEEIPLE